MDSAFILFITCVALFCWLYTIGDKTAAPIFRVLGIFFALPTLVYYLFYVMGATKSPVWNNIGGGWPIILAIGFGFVAIMSKPAAPRAPGAGTGQAV